MAKKKKQAQPEKPKFVPDNHEQVAAIEAMQDFILNGDPSEFFTLEGKAGTGKTTIVQEAITPFLRKSVIIAALSHKAKLVLANKIEARHGRWAARAETIASLLGMEMDVETGKFFAPDQKREPPICFADVLIVDECSMVNEQALALIMEIKPPHCKVIFCGDIGQLPPIREGVAASSDAHSPTFNTKNKAVLLTRVRQGEASPILPFADYFWNNSQSEAPVQNPAPQIIRQSVVNDAGALVFSKSERALEKVLHLYSRSVKTGNPDIIRTIVYKNATRQFLNNKIRKMLFPLNEGEQFTPGDLIVFSDNYGSGVDKISNSTETQVKHVRRYHTSEGWEVFELGASIDGVPRQLPVLSLKDVPAFKKHLDELANWAKGLWGEARRKAWAHFYGAKGRFAPIDYSYTITSHKAQGSTYDVAMVAEADIMEVQATTNKSKSQSVYTGITRARHVSIILDGYNDHGEDLERALQNLNLQYVGKLRQMPVSNPRTS